MWYLLEGETLTLFLKQTCVINFACIQTKQIFYLIWYRVLGEKNGKTHCEMRWTKTLKIATSEINISI